MKIVNQAVLSTKHLYCLDIFRVAIVFLVLFFHLNIHFSFETNIKIIDRFVNQGAFTMSMFFMLSGFILYYLYHNNDFYKWDVLKNFLKKRILKIYPLYIISVVLFYFIFYYKQVPLFMWGMQIIPLQAFFPATFNEFWNGGLWFISALLFSYCIFPFASQTLKFAKINTFLLYIIVYVLCTYFTVVAAYYPETTSQLYISPLFRSLEFFAGMIVAKLSLEYQSIKIKGISAMLVFLCFLIFLLVGGMSHSNFLNHEKFCSSYLNYNLFTIPLFSIILYLCTIVESGSIYQIAKTKICQYLSKISFAFYLGQGFTLEAIKKIYILQGNGYLRLLFDDKILFLLFASVFNIILAIVMYEFVFKQIDALLRKQKILNYN